MPDLSDAELERILVTAPSKLRTLAAWLDMEQDAGKLPGDPEDRSIQADLRDWADLLDRLMDFFDGVSEQIDWATLESTADHDRSN